MGQLNGSSVGNPGTIICETYQYTSTSLNKRFVCTTAKWSVQRV